MNPNNEVGPKKIFNGEKEGKLIAFVGVDGSGKSTISDIISNWLLENNFKTKKVYLGSGDGNINRFSHSVVKLRMFLKSYIKTDINKKIGTLKENTRDLDRVEFFKNPMSYINLYLRALSLYAISKDNKRKLIEANDYRNSGGLIVFDRFPQLQQKNINDGPKLEKYAELLDSTILKFLSNYEIKNLEIANKIRPDIVFRLNVSPEVSFSRKAEHTDIHYLENKSKSIQEISFKGSTVYEIDSNNELELVLVDIKNLLQKDLSQA